MTRPKLAVVPTKGTTAERTDLRNAERLVELFGADLRFVHAWKRYQVWDGTRWMLDDTGGAMRCASETARILVTEAVQALQSAATSGDEDKQKDAKAAYGHACKSSGSSRLKAMLDIASSFKSIAVAHTAFDADPMVLNVANGTIDLRTGKLRAHRREDLITKLAPIVYEPTATAPTWEAFLHQAMGGNAELVAFLQRLVGYALTGSIKEHALGFFFGGGANGKSTWLSTVHSLMGDYAQPAPRGLLFRSRGERHPTELASLFGARFVTCSEIGDGQAFDEPLVKDLTGGDPISARKMREDFWSFAPTHKFFIAGNHKPKVQGDDDGIWRRLRLVPWEVTIAKADQDKELPAKLRGELPGILAWAVRGCIEWQRIGLGEPIEVTQATAAYRAESDPLAEFVAMRCVFQRGVSIARKVLRENYETFCRENGATPLGAKKFAAGIRKRGAEDMKVKLHGTPYDGWNGVRLRRDDESPVVGSDIKGGESPFSHIAANTNVPVEGYRETGHYKSLPRYEGEQETFASYVADEGIGGAE